MTNNSIYLRFDVWLVPLDPTIGHEIKKTRPCVIISPNELSQLSTVLVAPLTTQGFKFPSRIKCLFQNKSGFILLDHMRAVDKRRLIKKLGTLDKHTARRICDILQEMFSFEEEY